MQNRHTFVVALVALTLLIVACAAPQSAPPAATSDDNVAVSAPEPAAAAPEPPVPADTQAAAGAGVTGAVAAGSVHEIRIEAFKFGFEPATVTVKQGEKVRLVATSRDGTHGIAIPAFGVNTGDFGPGDTKTVAFTADKAGEYPFFCNVFCGSGHRSMKGTLVVTA